MKALDTNQADTKERMDPATTGPKKRGNKRSKRKRNLSSYGQDERMKKEEDCRRFSCGVLHLTDDERERQSRKKDPRAIKVSSSPQLQRNELAKSTPARKKGSPAQECREPPKEKKSRNGSYIERHAMKKLQSLLRDPSILEEIDAMCCRGISEEHIDTFVEALVEINRENKQNGRDDPVVDLLRVFIRCEIARTKDEALLFRADSLSSKIFKLYSKIIGLEFLKHAIGHIVMPTPTNPSSAPASLRNPPPDSRGRRFFFGFWDIQELRKSDATQDRQLSRKNSGELMKSNHRAMQVLDSIILAQVYAPKQFRAISACLSKEVEGRFPNSRYQVLGAFLFMRFFCPALVTPFVFGLTEETETADRGLILVAKVLQNTVNVVDSEEKNSEDANAEKLRQFLDEMVKIEDEDVEEQGQIEEKEEEESSEEEDIDEKAQTELSVARKQKACKIVHAFLWRYQNKMREKDAAKEPWRTLNQVLEDLDIPDESLLTPESLNSPPSPKDHAATTTRTTGLASSPPPGTSPKGGQGFWRSLWSRKG